MSATRRYEVSFKAELDDRQVNELADNLFDLGWDDVCFRPLATPRYDDPVADRDAMRAADQHEIQRTLK